MNNVRFPKEWPTPERPMYIPQSLIDKVKVDTDPKLNYAREWIKDGTIQAFETYNGEELDGMDFP